MNLIQEYIEFWEIRYENIFEYLLEHLSIAFVSIIFAIVLTVPLAIGMTKMKNERLKQAIFNVANFFQTIPTIALFALLIPIFGIGFTPAVVALFLYALLPLLRNTYAGVESIDQGIVEAAKGWAIQRFNAWRKWSYRLRCLILCQGFGLQPSILLVGRHWQPLLVRVD